MSNPSPSHEPGELDVSEQGILLRIARDALAAHVLGKHRPDVESYPLTGPLRQPRGAFVTLRVADELRGCIGHTANLTMLAETVGDCSVGAASRDPRFPPLTEAELPETRIEISVLGIGDTYDSPFIRVRDVSEFVIGRDGCLLRSAASRGGLLLPQVASERDWTAEQFLSAACTKALLPEDEWRDKDTELFRFTAQVFGE